VVVLTEALVEQDLLLMMKDGDGNFYNPEFNFNNIPGWDVAQGYLMKLTDPGDLTLEGETVLSDEPIELEEGWQIISCYLRFPVEATIAFSGIEEQLIIAKDEDGNFYNPEFNFSNMGEVTNGNGYHLKMSEAAELVYRIQLEDEEAAMVSRRADVGFLGGHSNTGRNMSLLMISAADLSGDIGVYAGDVLVGSGVLSGGVCGVAIWGDDQSTEAVDGAVDGAGLELRLWDGTGFRSLSYSSLRGDGVYATDGLWVVELGGTEALPVEFGIESAYPNPFNSRTQIRFGLADASVASLHLYDLSGRLLREISLGRLSAGSHVTTVDGATLSSGVYLLELVAGAEFSRRKLTLVK